MVRGRRVAFVAFAACAVFAAATLAACSDEDDSAEPTSAAPAAAQVRVVSQNLLHGIACAPDSDRCDLPARVELFVRQLATSGCPELVGVQEANERTVDLLRAGVAGVCDGAYEVVWDGDAGVDREVVLTTDTVLGSHRERLAGALRTALWVRVATDVGAVDLVTTHLASSSDDRPCDAASCPPPCEANDTLNLCQARQTAAFARRVATDGGLVVIAGDLNARPTDPTMDALGDAGFTDTHAAAGTHECDPATGDGCTSGRVDDAMTDLRDPASTQRERIDYVLTSAPPSRRCEPVTPTGLFHPAADRRGARGVVFASDHTAVQATIRCRTTAAQRRAATRLTVPSTTSTTAAAGAPRLAADDVAAITAAFRAVFDGSVVDVDVKLAALEDGDLLRASFVESYERTRAVAERVRLRIDDIRPAGADRADVVYTLLLDGNAVLDHLTGSAVRSGGAWLVTRRTYCDVATQGAATIPEPCR